jgi:hypothetical protein
VTLFGIVNLGWFALTAAARGKNRTHLR